MGSKRVTPSTQIFFKYPQRELLQRGRSVLVKSKKSVLKSLKQGFLKSSCWLSCIRLRQAGGDKNRLIVAAMAFKPGWRNLLYLYLSLVLFAGPGRFEIKTTFKAMIFSFKNGKWQTDE